MFESKMGDVSFVSLVLRRALSTPSSTSSGDGLSEWVKGRKFLAGDNVTYVDFALYEVIKDGDDLSEYCEMMQMHI
jgi:hypothetical protein